jgi:hypothetical protein
MLVSFGGVCNDGHRFGALRSEGKSKHKSWLYYKSLIEKLLLNFAISPPAAKPFLAVVFIQFCQYYISL